MGHFKDSLEGPMGCPGCGSIPEKVYGQWWPHIPGDLINCRGYLTHEGVQEKFTDGSSTWADSIVEGVLHGKRAGV